MADGGGTGQLDRAAPVVGAALAGLLVGVIGTFKHRVGVSVATGAGLPVGLVLCLAMVLVFLIALRLASPARWIAAAGAVGVVAAVAVLALPGPGGSRVVLQDVAGITWLVGPVVLAAVVVAWPRRAGRRPRRPASDGAGGILGDRPAE